MEKIDRYVHWDIKEAVIYLMGLPSIAIGFAIIVIYMAYPEEIEPFSVKKPLKADSYLRINGDAIQSTQDLIVSTNGSETIRICVNGDILYKGEKIDVEALYDLNYFLVNMKIAILGNMFFTLVLLTIVLHKR